MRKIIKSDAVAQRGRMRLTFVSVAVGGVYGLALLVIGMDLDEAALFIFILSVSLFVALWGSHSANSWLMRQYLAWLGSIQTRLDRSRSRLSALGAYADEAPAPVRPPVFAYVVKFSITWNPAFLSAGITGFISATIWMQIEGANLFGFSLAGIALAIVLLGVVVQCGYLGYMDARTRRIETMITILANHGQNPKRDMSFRASRLAIFNDGVSKSAWLGRLCRLDASG